MSKEIDLKILKTGVHKELVRIAKRNPELFKRVRKDYVDQLKLTLKDYIVYLMPLYKIDEDGYDNSYIVYVYSNNFMARLGIRYVKKGGMKIINLKEGDNPIEIIMDFYNKGHYNKTKTVFSNLLENLEGV